jgi:hypothetical protein
MRYLATLAIMLALAASASAQNFFNGKTTVDAPAGSTLTFVISTPTSTPAPSSTETDNTDGSVLYSNSAVPSTTWSSASGSEFYDGSEEVVADGCVTPIQSELTVQGAEASINFKGTNINLIGETGPNFGIGQYSLDGGSPVTFNAYSASNVYQTALVSLSGLANESHVLKYEVMCNTSGSGVYQAVDAWTTDGGTPNEFSSATIYSWENGNVTFGGSSWNCAGSGASPFSNGQDLSGGHCYDGTAGDYVQWTFTGSLIEVFTRPDKGDGYFDVYIDGSYVTTVNGQYTQDDNDQLTAYLAFAESGLSSGSHTIQLVVDGSEAYPSETENSGIKNLIQWDAGLAFP